MLESKSNEEIVKESHEYRVTEKVFLEYTTRFKGNEDLTKEEVTNKLYRNILLSIKNTYWNDTSDDKFVYYYGSMRIVVKNKTIIRLINNRPIPKGWYKNKAEYERLNDLLRIYY